MRWGAKRTVMGRIAGWRKGLVMHSREVPRLSHGAEEIPEEEW